MLNKENTQKAEQIAKECEPLFKKCAQLLKKARESAKISRIARDKAHYWLYVKSQGGNPYGEYMTEEEKTEALNTRENEPSKWRENYEQFFKDYEHASNEAKAREINYKNYCRYTLRVVGEKLRPIFAELVNRKGLDTFAEILNKSAHNLRPRLWVETYYENGASVGANIYGGEYMEAIYLYYNYDVKTSDHQPKAPKIHNGATYEKALAKLEAVRKQAQALCEKSREIAKTECVYGFAEFIGHIAMTK